MKDNNNIGNMDEYTPHAQTHMAEPWLYSYHFIFIIVLFYGLSYCGLC